MQIVLKLLSDPQVGQTVVLPSSDCILGRSDDCGVQLNSKHISRRHCRIRLEKDQVWVCDLGSRNGTYVNHTRLEQHFVATWVEAEQARDLLARKPA